LEEKAAIALCADRCEDVRVALLIDIRTIFDKLGITGRFHVNCEVRGSCDFPGSASPGVGR
jgi:hypothetical protein